jgi:NADPH-dependent 2,4-dienoyl-CoA reductase/sulfur reductase-like enzyme
LNTTPFNSHYEFASTSMASMAIDESFNGAPYDATDDASEIENVVVAGAGPAGLMLA